MAEGLRILVVDDDEQMRRMIKVALEREQFSVGEAKDGRECLQKVTDEVYNLIVLDVMMPNMDGWEVCREIRKSLDLPIIMLSARGEEIDRVLGLELGADDYLVKPFSPRELIARIRALLRRTNGSGNNGLNGSIACKSLSLDPIRRRVLVEAEEVTMTPREFDLLLFLVTHQGQVFTREQLLNQVWGYDFFGNSRTVDTHINTLRDKLTKRGLESPAIATVWGVGYKVTL